MQYDSFAIARKYARSFLAVCYPQPGTVPLAVIESLKQFFVKHRQLVGLLGRCLCAKPFLHEGLANFFMQKFGCSVREILLFKILTAHRKIQLLTDILQHISDVEHLRLNQKFFIFEASHTLDQQTVKNIVKHFESQTRARIEYAFVVNTNLICGIRLYSKTQLYEKSVQRELVRLENEVKKLGGLW